MMKTLMASLCSLVLIVFLLLSLPVNGEEALYENIVRLHVLPASDSAEDQELKILVRDAILEKYGKALGTLQSAEEAELYLNEKLPEIEDYVLSFLEERGYQGSAKVSLTEEHFETRAYGDITLPSGTYTSLTVTIDGGKGQNWWCVLYPSLCTEAALGGRINTQSEAFTEAEYNLITESGYLLKFRTLEILESIFGNER